MPIPYKSFCWCLGTTSFRTRNFNKTIELQLNLLSSFWNLPQNTGKQWTGNDEIQSAYYDHMKQNDFLVGDASNKPKDAREKTSGLVDIGLITNERKLTSVGDLLLDISKKSDFEDCNIFHIAKDSFLFAKQLLKTSCEVGDKIVRPFIVLIYLLSKLDYLTFEEFTYLLPLCVDNDSTHDIIKSISLLRNNEITKEQIIYNRLISMDNYQSALKCLLENDMSLDLVCNIGLNRKSRLYDMPYYQLYKKLKSVYLDHDYSEVYQLYLATSKITIGKYWRSLLFNTASSRSIKNDPVSSLNITKFSRITTEQELKQVFFEIMHTNKALATLSDYFDLNRRYIKTTDLILFQDGIVKLDILPKYFFAPVIDCLYQDAFKSNSRLEDDVEMKVISPCLQLDEQDLLTKINEEFGTSVTNLDHIWKIIEDDRYQRFHTLIQSKFTDENLLDLLDKFQNREDSKIQEQITDNADVPTLFEYVLGILWYKVSNFKGKILDYMKLSLDADLLPKTHAAGGEADVVYEYEETTDYPRHCMLLEATLADSTNQRRMEMEPVSRHLGQHRLKTNNEYSYCVFVTNYLDSNVVSDFRGRKYSYYYDPQDNTKMVKGLNIIPLTTQDLQNIIKKALKYPQLYQLFKNAYEADGETPLEWRKAMIEDRLK